ncbi:MAG TPA: hypothetical protein VFU47_05315 [Armatimonadota bacterium]|nr:hypothetical protein [Armatimonadota bacterium]
MTRRRDLELNEPSRPRAGPGEFREYLISASNELYLFEMLSLQTGRPVPEALRRAHASIRAEMKRLEVEEEAASGG